MQRVWFLTCMIYNAYLLIHESIFNHWRRIYTYEKRYIRIKIPVYKLIHVRKYTCLKPYVLQTIRVWNHTRYKSYALQIIRVWYIRVWNDGIPLDDQRHTPVLLSPRNARRNVLRHDGLCADVAVMRPWRNDSRAVIHVCRQSNVLICTTDSTVSQPPITLLIHVHCYQNLHFDLDMWHKLTLG